MNKQELTRKIHIEANLIFKHISTCVNHDQLENCLNWMRYVSKKWVNLININQHNFKKETDKLVDLINMYYKEFDNVYDNQISKINDKGRSIGILVVNKQLNIYNHDYLCRVC